jgi:hypothetical protein
MAESEDCTMIKLRTILMLLFVGIGAITAVAAAAEKATPKSTKDVGAPAGAEAMPLAVPGITAEAPLTGALARPDDKGYKIEKPGTITFTVGVVIKGKVEKPQVVIFLPKEKPDYEPFMFNQSFKEDLMKPLPLRPMAE